MARHSTPSPNLDINVPIVPTLQAFGFTQLWTGTTDEQQWLNAISDLHGHLGEGVSTAGGGFYGIQTRFDGVSGISIGAIPDLHNVRSFSMCFAIDTPELPTAVSGIQAIAIHGTSLEGTVGAYLDDYGRGPLNHSSR